MKIINEKTTEIKVYELENGFVLEVEKKGTSKMFYDFWLYHESYGVKDYLFGVEVEETKIDDWVNEFIKNDIDEHVAYYNKTYMN